MCENFIIDAAALTPDLLDDDLVTLCGPCDYRIGGQVRQNACSVWGFQVPGPDHAFVGIEQVAAQCVQGFALVELMGDLAPVVRPDRYFAT